MKLVSPTAETIDQAAQELTQGALVAFPSETVYGLGADATNGQAIARLYAAKNRPAVNPLIVHLGNRAEAEKTCSFDDTAKRLGEAFWPGALTLVAPLMDSAIVSAVTANLPTLAVRVPAHPVAQDLLKAVHCPIAAPSANRSGRPSATEAQHVADDFAESEFAPALILDAGASEHGLESTIVLCLPDKAPTLLRYGAISRPELEEVLGAPLAALPEATEATEAIAIEATEAVAVESRPLSPGRHFRHYAPAIPVRLLRQGESPRVERSEAWLGFGSTEPIGTPLAAETLSPSGNPQQAAHNLFAALRRLEVSGATAIVVAPLPASAEALRERVSRAAAIGPVEAL